MTTRTLTAQDIPEMLAAVNESVLDHAVGFVKVSGSGEDEDADVGGSGTLVAVGDRRAILTADHVLAALPREGKVGLALGSSSNPRLHRYTIDIGLAQKIRVAPASYDRHGPDLGLLLLPERDATQLSATKVFYHLARRRDRMLSNPRGIDMGGWFLCGLAHEWTSELPGEHGYTRVKGFRGLLGAGVVTRERHDGVYDYLDFEVKYGATYEGPVSFQGFSGGGLWQAELNDRDGSIEIADVLLSGVVFYESEVVDDLRTVYCHGRRSIYEHVIAAMAS